MTVYNYPYNRMSFRHRLQATVKLFSRSRKLGSGQLINSVMRGPLLLLHPTPRLDGLSLYRQALSKLVVPEQVSRDDGRTILLVSHC